MIWRNPLAWLGLATLLVPIAIHLLVRQQAQPMAFPSLRFLESSRLAAVRRRRLSDWLLLAVRLLILAAAVAALADPFFLNDSRRAAWASRVARAIVVDTSGAASATPGTASPVMPETTTAAVRAEEASAFASTVIASANLQAGVARGLAWLSTAPPAAREIVIVSPLTRGRVSAAVSESLPVHVGLRFARVGPAIDERVANGRPASLRADNRPDAAGFETRTPAVTVRADSTSVRWDPPTPGGIDVSFEENALIVRALGLRVEAAPRDMPAARAALDAVLSEGIPVAGQTARPVVIALEGGASASSGTSTGVGAGSSTGTGTGTGTGTRGNGSGPAGGPTDPSAVASVSTSAPASAPAPATREIAMRPLAAPWMADALQRIADEPLLEQSVASIDLAARGVVSPTAAASPASSASASSAPAASGVSGVSGPSAASEASPASSAANTSASQEQATPLVLFRALSGQPVVTAGAAASSATGDGLPALLLVSRAPAESDVTALLLRAALRATASADPLPDAEVARIPDEQLAAWQRPASLPPPEELTRVDTHDRRWFWGAALILLLVERLLRARMRREEPAPVEVAHAA